MIETAVEEIPVIRAPPVTQNTDENRRKETALILFPHQEQAVSEVKKQVVMPGQPAFI